MKAVYFWIGTSASLLLCALFFKHLPETQGWMMTGALLCLTVGFLWKVCRNA